MDQPVLDGVVITNTDGSVDILRTIDGSYSPRYYDFAELNGGVWTASFLTATAGSGWAGAAVIDSQNRVHLVLSDSQGLGHWVRTQGSWSREPVSLDEWFSVDAAIGGGDVLHVCAARRSGSSGSELVHFVRDAAGSWTGETVDASVHARRLGGRCRMRLTADGSVHIAYNGDRDVRHAVRRSEVWQITPVTAGESLLDFELSRAGQPFAALARHTAEGVYLAREQGGAWTNELVSRIEIMDVALALDDQGRPQLMISSRDACFLVTDRGGSWVTDLTVPMGFGDPFMSRGGGTDLHIDSAGHTHALCARGWWSSAVYATRGPRSM